MDKLVEELRDAEHIARLFHETYERLAPQFSYETRKASAVPWEQVPENNRRLMVAVAGAVRDTLAQACAAIAQKRVNELEADNARLRAERDEESAWDAVVDAHGGLDGFDALAAQWVAREPIRRMFNASCSVFSKWSNDELMGRFKTNLTNVMQLAFAEGCVAGSRARAALPTMLKGNGDG